MDTPLDDYELFRHLDVQVCNERLVSRQVWERTGEELAAEISRGPLGELRGTDPIIWELESEDWGFPSRKIVTRWRWDRQGERHLTLVIENKS